VSKVAASNQKTRIGETTPRDAEFWKLSASMRDMRDLEPFRSFEELRRSHIEGVDYRVEERRGAINLLCAAWHGGRMELGSDILANAIAGERFHYYAFSALIPHSGQ
jgi:phage replication-related protein YjqB (UPF0714/DUF867 family)